jgi:hypothetical protein
LTIKITLRNPINQQQTLDYFIEPDTSQLAQDWVTALKQDLLAPKLMLEKNYCFIGFAKTSRTLEYLCEQLNCAVYQINTFNRARVWQNAGLPDYQIEEWFSPDVVRYGTEYPVAEGGNQPYDVGLQVKHNVMNRLHYHFEQLQGTVWNLSGYYQLADYNTKYAIRQLNNICHEIESLVLSQRKAHAQPEWQRPSQITTWLAAPRHELTDQHRQGFLQNGYDRQFGHVYMHWTQIGKTLIEIFRDEGAPELTETICSAINELRFYSGEFDIEWGKDVVYNSAHTPWHTDEQDRFKEWLIANNRDPADPKLSLGYLHLGQVDLLRSFGTQDPETIWESMSQHLDIYKIEVDGVSATYDYCWTDVDHKEQQIAMMKPGYDYQTRIQQ